jgi:hypothetical protein
MSDRGSSAVLQQRFCVAIMTVIVMVKKNSNVFVPIDVCQ